ncbi:hypothetical protein BWR17_09665 [Phaeobacter inhibens]|nr:hypothetical protein BWR17_09665 [Phaeobacter inhibens]
MQQAILVQYKYLAATAMTAFGEETTTTYCPVTRVQTIFAGMLETITSSLMLQICPVATSLATRVSIR